MQVSSYLSWYRSFENEPIIDHNSKRLYFLSDWFSEKKNFNVTKKLKKKLINLILSLKENERETIKKNINEVLNHRIINDAKNLNEAKLRYKLKKHNFAQNIIKNLNFF